MVTLIRLDRLYNTSVFILVWRTVQRVFSMNAYKTGDDERQERGVT